MDSTSRLYTQVAAEAGVAPERAMVGCYLADLSRAGKTLDDAAELMRSKRSAVRTIARDWGVQFPDFVPGNAVCLEWEKEKRGRWILKQGRLIMAEAVSFTEGGCSGYRAKTFPDGLTAEGSSAEVAMRRLSIEMEENSIRTLGLDDVEISMPDVGVLAPKLEPMSPSMRKALNT